MMRAQEKPAFTLAEAIVGTVIVAIVIVTAMNAAGSVRRTEMSAANRAFGVRLAEELIEEIERTSYMDPATKIDDISLDAGEAHTNRRTLDDVDDFHGLRDEPPTDTNGAAIVKASGWSRMVEVAWTRADDPMADAVTSGGRKRITVTVQYGSKIVAQLVAFRAQSVPARKEY
jgi:hypothetical protein